MKVLEDKPEGPQWTIRARSHRWHARRAQEAGDAKRGYGSPPFVLRAHNTARRHNAKRKAFPLLGKGLWVHILESQDTTPRKRTGKGNSLNIVWASSEGQQASAVKGSDPRGPLPLGCGRKFARENDHFHSSLFKALDCPPPPATH